MPFSFDSVGSVEGGASSDGVGAGAVSDFPGSPPEFPVTTSRTFCQKPGTMFPLVSAGCAVEHRSGPGLVVRKPNNDP
jgi:hypothetical protein